MTSRPGRRRIVGVLTPYHRLLDEAIGERNVSEVAREWGVPRYVLFDGLSEKSKRPSLVYAAKIASGLNMSAQELLDKLAPAPQVEAVR